MASLHAEHDALRRCKTKAKTLMVVRFDKKGELTGSKPCYHCFQLIKQYGIKKVYYSEKGTLVCCKVKDMVCSHVSWGFQKLG